MSNNTNPASLIEADVADYLAKHPNFFNGHLELLKVLNIPHASGDAVSLVERQLQVLRQSNRDAKSRFNKVLNVAKDNETHFENTKTITLELLDFMLRQDELNNLFAIFDNRFSEFLAADEYRFILFNLSDNEQKALNHRRIKHVNFDSFNAEHHKLASLEKSLCSALVKEERQFLFDDYASNVGSCAVVPMRFDKLQGLLVLGNTDKEYFHKGLGTLFLDHISSVIERCFVTLLTRIP